MTTNHGTILNQLSANEIFCLTQKNYEPRITTTGNCVNTLGMSKEIESDLKGCIGEELKTLSKTLYDGRHLAYTRLLQENNLPSPSGVIGVTSQLFFHWNHLEFLATGTLVSNQNSQQAFSTNANGKQLFSMLDLDFNPISFVLGNTAYSTSVSGGLIGKLKSFRRGEVETLTEIFNKTRQLPLQRIKEKAKKHHTNAIINIDAKTLVFKGANEILMTGTAASHSLFSNDEVMTSTLSPNDMWSLAQLGYAPVQVLVGSAVFSLGFFGNLSSAIKSLYLKEIPEFTQLIDQGRKLALEKMNLQAEALSAEQVIDIKTSLSHLGGGLIECFAIGTAIKKLPGIKTRSDQLPFQTL